MSDRSPERYVMGNYVRESEVIDTVTDRRKNPSQGLHLFALAQSLKLNNRLPSRAHPFLPVSFLVLLLIQTIDALGLMPTIKEEESDYLVTSWAHFKSSRPRTSLAVLPKLYVLGIFPFIALVLC